MRFWTWNGTLKSYKYYNLRYIFYDIEYNMIYQVSFNLKTNDNDNDLTDWLTEFHGKFEDSNQVKITHSLLTERKNISILSSKLSSKCLGLKRLLDMGTCFLKAVYGGLYQNRQCE